MPGYDRDVIPGRAFKIHEEQMNWKDAQTTCQSEGGDLVRVDKPEINSWLVGYMQEQWLVGQELWIGATDAVGFGINPGHNTCKTIFEKANRKVKHMFSWPQIVRTFN